MTDKQSKQTKQKNTHFGFESVTSDEKTKKVTAVFESVAKNYDLMNDLMSFGMHRFWKYFSVILGKIKASQTVLDLAGGSGDLTRLLSYAVGPCGQVILADINAAMLELGRARLTDEGIVQNVDYVQANAEILPFPDNHFHVITIGFGLRNVTDKAKALADMFRVLQFGGKIMILEFSTPVLPGVNTLYDWYSFNILPKLGKYIAGDAKAYQYLAESIRMHPNQENLQKMITAAGFEDCKYYNLSAGIVALHIAYKY